MKKIVVVSPTRIEISQIQHLVKVMEEAPTVE